ncbi:dihydrolipoamide acetyltransferase family protein [Comamonadaceae bacterium G21597-S1]|nr:dihydrolipoamide acetyltransferase family protein [Comamonadaceae bacterium G21597-S1]
MANHTVKMPDLGEGITEVEVVAWHVQVGDTVTEDQVLADVMTDKATVEIPSPVAGLVARLGGEVGDVLAVGAALIDIAVDGDGDGDGDGAAASAPAGPIPAPAAPSAPARDEPPRTEAASRAPAGKAASPPATTQQAPAPRAPAVSDGDEKPIASPAVRRRAWELGVDLRQVRATGAGGRIMQADLDAHVARHGGSAPGSAGLAAAVVPARAGEDSLQEIKVIGLRRRIAQKMQESKRRIPHFAYVEECDVTELESLRAQLNRRFGDSRGKLTLLPFLVRAMVLAIGDFPQVNAVFDDETGIITRHGAVHMGIATQTDAGLMVPVLRHAQDGDLWANAHGISRLAEMTRSGRATRDELTGSSITLTSLGALGGIVSTPIINAPEVAIVGVNRIVERPMLVGGTLVARKTMNLSSSFDHRVVDGQDAAKFIQAVRGHIEAPGVLLAT